VEINKKHVYICTSVQAVRTQQTAQTLPRRALPSKWRMVSRHTRECNVSHAHKNCGLPGADFTGIHDSSTALRRDPVHRISLKRVKKHGNAAAVRSAIQQATTMTEPISKEVARAGLFVPRIRKPL
jgi:hypothetical protein